MKHSSVVVSCIALASSCSLFSEKKAGGNAEAAPQVIEGTAPIVIVVPHEELTKVLPQQLDGWKNELSPGVVIDNGVESLSRARANYWREVSGEPESFNLEIVDGTHVPSVQVGLAIAAQAGDMLQRTGMTVQGYPGLLQRMPESNGVTATIVIARRFVVTLRGTNVDANVVKRALEAIDVKRLEQWAGVENVGKEDTSEPNTGVALVATTGAASASTPTGATTASTTAAP